MNLMLRWLFSVVAVWLTVCIGQAFKLPLAWDGWLQGFLFILVLGFVNAIIRPIVKLATLPLTCLTLGMFGLVVNTLLFWATAHYTGWLVVGSFWAALFGSVVYGVLSGIINSFVKKQRRR